MHRYICVASEMYTGVILFLIMAKTIHLTWLMFQAIMPPIIYMNYTKKNIWTYVFLDYFQSIWSILSEKNIHTQIYSFNFAVLPITYQRFEKHKINIFVNFPCFSMIICLFYMVLEICCSNSIQQFRYFCQNVSFMAQNL